MNNTYFYFNGKRFINVSLSRFPQAVHRMNEADKKEFVGLFFERQKSLRAINSSSRFHSLETIKNREQTFEHIETRFQALIRKYQSAA